MQLMASRVGGDVVSRQTLQIEDGATVAGSVEDLETRWDYWDVTFVGRFVWWLAYTVSTLVLGLVLLLLADRIGGLAASDPHAALAEMHAITTRHTLKLLRAEERSSGKPARDVTGRLREYRQLTETLRRLLPCPSCGSTISR